MAITEIIKEILWLLQLLNELSYKVVTPILVHVDNQSAIKIAENDVDHDRTKHIDTRYYFVRECIQEKIIKIEWISTQDQLGDIFTKALGATAFVKFRDLLMVNKQL
jgi:hypothetical protein